MPENVVVIDEGVQEYNKTLSGSRFDKTSFEEEMDGRGRLIVQATTAGGALPVQGAIVTVTKTDGEMIEKQTTDKSGRTQGVYLPAPSYIYSQSPGDLRPYSTYNVRVEATGFFTQNLLNVAVFDGVESIQPVALEPVGEDQLEDNRI